MRRRRQVLPLLGTLPPLGALLPRGLGAPARVLLMCLSAGAPAAAHAQEAKPTQPEAADAEQAPEITDAEAVKRARGDIDAWVRELLAREDIGDWKPSPPSTPPAVLDAPPPSLSSRAPPSPLPPPDPPELEWLVGARLPDFPVRWEPRLYEQLAYYREDERGRAHMRALIQRSGRYETMVRRILREAGLPEDLLYVAMVESGYDPTARSPAGAVGMWQFVKGTAGDYDLEVNRFLDERMNVERSTLAAARFFRDLHRQLGSWPLALAAFNMGYGALTRSIRKYNTNDFWLLSRLEAGLPYETVVYVTKVMASAIVAHNPERFGLGDVQKDPPDATVRVHVPGGTGLGRLARAAGMSTEALARLNPELRRARVPPDLREFALRIPSDRLERFRARWPQVGTSTGSHAIHVLRFGERLRDVAEMYDTSELKLRRLNALADDGEPRPGTRLLVPDVEPRAPEVSQKPVVGVPDKLFRCADRRHVFYRVRDGDTVEQVSAFFDVTIDELRLWNEISTDAALISDMILQLFVPRHVDLSAAVVWKPGEVQALTVGSADFFEYHESQRDRVRVRYRVDRGDSLQSLSSRFDLSVGSIARINGFSRYSDLEPGNEIILYVPKESAGRLAGRVD